MKTLGRSEAVGAAVAPPPAVLTPAHDTMRRLQIGIAGLLTVLLLVGLAGVIGNRARESAAKDGAATDKVQMPGEVAASKPAGAPLEELGVQPVSKDENEAVSVKVPQAAPIVPDLDRKSTRLNSSH